MGQIKKMKKSSKKTEKKAEASSTNAPRISIRGRVFTGEIISDKMTNTVTVQWSRNIRIPKYERYEKRKSKVKAHLPSNINAKKGDFVRIAECKPLSKTKKFVVFEKIEENKK